MTEPVKDFQRVQEWNAVVDRYEQAFVKVSRKYARHAMRLAGLEPGMHVLDVCAGTGALSIQAAQAGATVDGIDYSPAMLDRLRTRIAEAGVSGITLHQMDGQALTFPDDRFDATFSIFGLMFFPDRHRGFSEQRRVLKPGGKTAIVLWNKAERVGNQRLLAQALKEAAPDVPPPDKPAHWQELGDAQRFHDEMEAAGYRNVHIHTIEDTWDAQSPTGLWEDQVGMTPALDVLFRMVGPERMERVRTVFIDLLRAENGGDGPVALPGEAHIGIGEK